MKVKIAILGSTGSIGKILLDIIDKDRKKFEIVLLTANKNHKTLLKQAKKFKVKNLIITDDKKYKILKSRNKNNKIKVFNSFDKLEKIFKKKIDYAMSSIVGLDGLKPTIKTIKFTKKIAIANKESLICGWNLINKELKKHKTKFVPVDSEHFSIWYGLKNKNFKNVEKVYLTASGGPFFKSSITKIKNANINEALNHPNWKMGKKISIDSATLINKIYEVIEAKNIFNIPYKKIDILIHPKSYIHALLKFEDGMLKIIAHDTTMKIPIFNSIYSNDNNFISTKKLDIKILNNLNFNKVNSLKFPMIKLLRLLPKKHSLFETVLVSANDFLVEQFLKKKIRFNDIQKRLFKILKIKEFYNYRNITKYKIEDIVKLNNYVRLKLSKKVYKTHDD